MLTPVPSADKVERRLGGVTLRSRDELAEDSPRAAELLTKATALAEEFTGGTLSSELEGWRIAIVAGKDLIAVNDLFRSEAGFDPRSNDHRKSGGLDPAKVTALTIQRERLILLNRDWLDETARSPERVAETILHESIHAVVPLAYGAPELGPLHGSLTPGFAVGFAQWLQDRGREIPADLGDFASRAADKAQRYSPARESLFGTGRSLGVSGGAGFLARLREPSLKRQLSAASGTR